MYLSSLFLLQLDDSISSTSVERGFSIIEQYIRAFPPYHFGITEIRDLWDVCKDFPECPTSIYAVILPYPINPSWD